MESVILFYQNSFKNTKFLFEIEIFFDNINDVSDLINLMHHKYIMLHKYIHILKIKK